MGAGVALLALLIVTVGGAPSAQAATFTVDRADDPDPSDDTTADDCTVADDDCTLRGAINAANTIAGADGIRLLAGTYELTSEGLGANGGDLNITSEITLFGAGADTTTIDGVASSVGNRVIEIDCACSVAITGVTIRGGRLVLGDPLGGGLRINLATVKMDSVHVTDNGVTENGTGSGANGGGIAVSALQLTITNSTISDNTADGPGNSFGGGIASSSSVLVIRNSTISGNTSAGATSASGGGIAANGGTLELASVTISGNSATTDSGGFSQSAGTQIIRNTIVAANSGGNCASTLSNPAGNNLSDDSSCDATFNDPSDLPNQPGPHLGTLVDDPGDEATPYYPLLHTSPGLDAGSLDCFFLTDAFGSQDTTDQRGEARIVDGDNSGGDPECDIGAFEREPDSDGDGPIDSEDNCPNAANSDQADTDGDGEGDACDGDDDGDGVPDVDDDCAATPTGTNIAADGCPDPDDDDVSTFGGDNCPSLANDQTNTDSDSQGDACDSDDDNDGDLDGPDNCNLVVNPLQEDMDGDDIGDACDGQDDRPTCNGQPATILDYEGTIVGTAGDDVIVGDDEDFFGIGNRIFGYDGDDIICARGGPDFVFGGAGADTLFGGEGHDTISYEPCTRSGVCVLPSASGVGLNLATGVNNQGDTLSGFESAIGSQGSDKITGTDSPNTLDGRGGDDILNGGDSLDTLLGGPGNDTLNGGARPDTLNGGAGSDTVSYAGLKAVRLTLGGGNNHFDTLTSIENVIGSANDDTITGNAGGNIIDGGAGNDKLNGGAGRDTIRGGAGKDTIDGGPPTVGDVCRGGSNPSGQQDVLTNCEDSIP
ncbi:MAG: thrombospondin type 3 repeat-containing protein [Dehalococcoidia bacterium]